MAKKQWSFPKKLLVKAACWLILAGLLVLGTPIPMQAQSLRPAEVHSLLTDSWERYKADFVQEDGRVIDWNGNITTSEGQSYAMLRAFWMRDRHTFDQAYQWAKDNLQVPRNDHLFSWKWGQRTDGTWGELDRTSATDADQDIALALILAHQEWKSEHYLADAKLILKDIWDRLTLDAPLGRVLLPGDWPPSGRTYRVNPSYFAPYAYRLFAEVDPDHDWKALIDSSYEIIARSMAMTTTKLPPDWVEISLDHDQIRLFSEPMDVRSDFGYESIRVYWRVAMDALLEPAEKRAALILNTRNMLPRYWMIRKDVPISITWDGIPRSADLQSGAVYGAILPALQSLDRIAADELVERKIVPNLKPGGQWNTKNDYYSQNWLWFGLGLYGLAQNRPMAALSRPSSRVDRLAALLKLKTQSE